MKPSQLLLLIIFDFLFSTSAVSEALNPMLLIPGDGGSKIYGKLNRETSNFWYCKKTSDWYTMWLNYEAFLDPFIFNCFMDDAQLRYNNVTGTYENVQGVQTKVDPPRSTNGCDYLDLFKWITYFGKIIEHLRTNRGYNSTNLYGYSYDWRYTPANIDKPSGEFENIQTLIEELYENNGKQKVVLVTHSLGGVVTQTFLERAKPAWKDKYILNWVSIGTPLFGAASAVASFSSGYNLDHPWLVPNFKLRIGLRTWPSTAWLIPYPKMWNDEPIVLTPGRNFTVSNTDMEEFFDAIEWPMGKMMYLSFKDIIKFQPPGVNMSCVYGSGVQTPAQFKYAKGLPDNGEENPVVFYGDGDGTVNLESGNGCLLWNGKDPNTWSKRYELPGVEHVDLLTNAKTIEAIDDVLGFSDYKFENKKSGHESGFEPETPTWETYIRNSFSKYVTHDLQTSTCYQNVEKCIQENNDIAVEQKAELCLETIQDCVKQKVEPPEWILRLSRELNIAKCTTDSSRKVKSSIFTAEFAKQWPMVMKSLPLVNKLNEVLAEKDYCFEDVN